MNSNPVFRALCKEAMFTKELLGSGVTQIRRANYATQGLYFQAFTNLSIGLERIGKLCPALDHFIDTNGKFPTEEQLKKSIGHDLVKLYNQSQIVLTKRKIKLRTLQTLDNPIQSEILSILSKFAKGDRYSNFDFLVGSVRQSDPTGEWYKKIDMQIFDREITLKKKHTIRRNAETTNRIMSQFGMVSHTSEDGIAIRDFDDASHRTGVFEAVAPKRQLYILQMIRYWSEIIFSLESLSRQIDKESTPYFGEILGGFANDDSYLRSRKTWDTI
ncbi:hypothetical protein IRZ53_10940 [Pseudomonas fulva]|uniref:hypothetical protein n=1 Tax=Pseudomonas fulva TaxID=47880 RepID=UPI0018AC6610|nr:hypothetical protein [Pseudomonas fulva]MBF8675199.1 hypothetical protein [Pseudomonas fulva]MBF8697305.1 hypothetical protein [Pseudomonas fulva]